MPGAKLRKAGTRKSGRVPRANRIVLSVPGVFPDVVRRWHQLGVSYSEMGRLTGIPRSILRDGYAKPGQSAAAGTSVPRDHWEAILREMPGHLLPLLLLATTGLGLEFELMERIRNRLQAYQSAGLVDPCRALCLELLQLQPPHDCLPLKNFLQEVSRRGWWLPEWLPDDSIGPRPISDPARESPRVGPNADLPRRALGTPDLIELSLCRALAPILDAQQGRGIVGSGYLSTVSPGGSCSLTVASLGLLQSRLNQELDLLPRIPSEEAAALVTECLAGDTPVGFDAEAAEAIRAEIAAITALVHGRVEQKSFARTKRRGASGR